MDELFDVFDAEPSAPAQNAAIPRRSKKEKKDKSKKRQVNGNVKENGSPTNAKKEDSPEDEVMEDSKPADEEQPVTKIEQPETKRQRIDEAPTPLVADAFETEQQVEIAGRAGLQEIVDASSLVVSHQVRHEVSVPPGYPYVPISQHKPPADPAKTYSFTLDPFQQIAVNSIQRDESVLVSAHTSAGKTVVAEYAIAQSLKQNQRVIYTSPIKALSNQKYREFAAEFGDVGLMTGDVTINPTASCLVMTTEILRSMLYRGSEIMREVQWVVFDEIHYMRDQNRGVVWEETLILLPDKVRYVFLSATIPNAMQFAEWVTKMHNQPCHVVYTNYRPTPLQHYFFPNGSEGMHLIVDEKGDFREDNFDKAMSTIADKKGADSNDPNAKMKGKGKDKKINKGGNEEVSDIYKIVRMVMVKSMNPVIIFSFSKRECEAGALQLKKLAFNDDSEKEMVSKVFNSAIEMLSPEDRGLEQIQNILPLLRKGVGVHHSGLLPILKEVIEILFQEGLIKVLFATETFSIGLNMPAKTVVFTSVRKFDGTSQRWITPSEFIQMSGRAGRRGLDDRGIVIMMIGEEMDPAVAKEIVRGEQDRLNSAFHLGYNMILNLMRVEGISPNYMLEQCFKQFQNQGNAAIFEEQLKQLEEKKAEMVISDEGTIREYYDIRKQLDQFAEDVRFVISHPNHARAYLPSGRLVHVKFQDLDFGWGVVVRVYPRKSAKDSKSPKDSSERHSEHQEWMLDVVLNLAEGPHIGTKTFQDLPTGLQPAKKGESIRTVVVPMMFTCLNSISHVRINLPKDIQQPSTRNNVRRSIDEVHRRFPDGVPVFDPIEDMEITDDSFKKLLRKIEVLESRLVANPLHNSPRLEELYSEYAEKVEIGNQIKATKKKKSDAENVIQLDELHCRQRVLRRLDFIQGDVVQLKARVACEISTGDELVLTQLLFDGFFNDLTPEQVAALMSVFVFEEKVKEAPPLQKKELAEPLKKIQEQARTVAKISQESKIALNEDEYVQSFHWELIEVMYEWAHGKSFAEICKMTDVYEGSLIRVFRRLEECLRQMAQAAKVMGSEDLESKFEAALSKIRRDIVAAQSLYL
ncbi:Helicase C-terminal [Penicillium angulare]|uniref:Helicase C-terminal n=1 Tax=Penicillium angulare TaxID=116970 RepID=UPI0025403897|nr:Helicase C-terminal [Penicillium angulare]KAJ5281547.1 Helicase C-terminal [Penicillium angulare]